MTAKIREWRDESWETGSKARSQAELQRMAKEIMANAESIKSSETPGYSRPSLSRVYVCKSTLVPNLEYIIHIDGFTVSDITEIERTA